LFSIRICYSFRLEADNALRLDTKDFINCATVAIPEDNPEIEQFICDELEHCIDDELLILGDPTLVADIMNTLLNLSQGMFLWVALQISSLCACKTDDDIRQALADIPRDLAETFTRVLDKCELSARKYQTQILGLVLVAKRPLTTEELREALGVVPGDTDWNPSRLPNNIYSVLASCGGLLTVDEETSSIRIVHQSAKDFLLGDFDGRIEKPLLASDDAQTAMSQTIITYLNYGIFDTQLSKSSTAASIPVVTPSAVIQSSSSSTVKSLSLMLLRAKKSSSSKIDIARVLDDIRGQAKKASDHDHPFYSYAASNWIHHLITTPNIDQTCINLVGKLLPKHSLNNHSDETRFRLLAWSAPYASLYATLYRESDDAPWFQHDMLSWAVRGNHVQLLETHNVTIPLKVATIASLLPIASLTGHYPCINFLMHLLPESLSTSTLATAVMMSITGNYPHIVRFLVTGQFAEQNAGQEAVENTPLTPQGAQILHSRSHSRKLLLWTHVFNREPLARLLIDLGAKTTDALQPKLEEELRAQTNDFSESSLLDEMKFEIFGEVRSALHGEKGGLDLEQEGMLISAARILFETKNVSLLNSFLIARQKGQTQTRFASM
jgi:hypothetical protein